MTFEGSPPTLGEIIGVFEIMGRDVLTPAGLTVFIITVITGLIVYRALMMWASRGRTE